MGKINLNLGLNNQIWVLVIEVGQRVRICESARVTSSNNSESSLINSKVDKYDCNKHVFNKLLGVHDRLSFLVD